MFLNLVQIPVNSYQLNYRCLYRFIDDGPRYYRHRSGQTRVRTILPFKVIPQK